MDQQKQIWPGLMLSYVSSSMWKVHYCVFKSNFKMQMHQLTDSSVRKIANFLAPCSFIFHKEWNIRQSFICWQLSAVTQTQHWPEFFLLRSTEVENEGSVFFSNAKLEIAGMPASFQGLQLPCSIPYSKFLWRKIYLFARHIFLYWTRYSNIIVSPNTIFSFSAPPKKKILFYTKDCEYHLWRSEKPQFYAQL